MIKEEMQCNRRSENDGSRKRKRKVRGEIRLAFIEQQCITKHWKHSHTVAKQ